jgi:two-component sensor histidine kinase
MSLTMDAIQSYASKPETGNLPPPHPLHRPARSATKSGTGADRTTSASRLEFLAETGSGLSLRRGVLLGALLDATLPSTYEGDPLLQPLWADEAMQRAYVTVFLIGMLEKAVPRARKHGFAASAERILAGELAVVLKSASYTVADAPVSCAHSVREVVRNVVELFGRAVGDVQIRTGIEPVTLPAFKARALLLLAHHLTVNALRHGFRASGGGQISVTLNRIRSTQARLVVTDTGTGFLGKRPGPPSLTWDLASLLEVKPIFYAVSGGGVSVKVEFPI